MSEPPASPTENDRRNAAVREAIAAKQNQEYAHVQNLARSALGPDWHPWIKISLIDSDHRRNGNSTPIATAFKICRGKQRLSEHSLFIRQMPDGTVRQAKDYEELFGDLLTEKHPVRQFSFKGQLIPAPRWEVIWSALEVYSPKDAATLAALRVSRERGREIRADKKWADDHPLLADAGIRRHDLGEGQGR